MVWQAIRGAALALGLVAFCALPARADYAAGQAAWDAGQYTEALAEWLAAADSGDSRAMLALGRLYREGLGALQNYVEAHKWFNVEAHKWFNLAASRGEAAAVPERDALAERMTPQQIASAQQAAASWRPGADRIAAAPPAPPDPAPAAAPPVAPAPAPAAVAPARPDPGPPPREAIREAQALLAALGYAPGPADGLWGRRSGAAYAAFLRDAGLPPSETLTPDALLLMREIAGPAAGEAARPAPPPLPAADPPPRAVPPGALHRAVQAGDIDGLNLALEAGADPDVRDGRGWTALLQAVDLGYTLFVQPLLAAGADPDLRAPDGAAALFIAAAHGHTEILVLLMEAGADVSIQGPQGQTAVDLARLRYGDAEEARRNGADPAVLALLERGTNTAPSTPPTAARPRSTLRLPSVDRCLGRYLRQSLCPGPSPPLPGLRLTRL